MTFIRYIIFIIIFKFGKSQELSNLQKPDITLLKGITSEYEHSIICVAGSSVDGNALTFITSLEGSNSIDIPGSTYRSPNGSIYPPDYFNCKFIYNSTCTQFWMSFGTIINSISSQYDLAPVIDERWENFPTYFSNNSYITNYNLRNKLNNIGISLRTSGEANILLCNNEAHCYWITLNENRGNKNFSTVLRNCVGVNFNRLPNKTDPNCGHLIYGKGLTCSDKFWSHFKLSLSSDTGFIAVKDTYNNNLFFKFNFKKFLYINKMHLFIDRDKKGLWKIHDYNYLSLPKNEYLFPVGKQLEVDKNGKLCIALYVAVCNDCHIILKLGSEVDNIRNSNGQRWQYRKLKVTNGSPGDKYNLYVSTTSIGGKSGFWLIGDTRRCHEEETRMISVKVNMRNNNIISCQAVQKPGWWASYRTKEIIQPKFDVCNRADRTGTTCGVLCTSALGSDCGKKIVCEPSSNRNDPNCACASGYTGPYCQDACPPGSYGSGCKHECEPCRGFCIKTTGECPDSEKCFPNDGNPGCLIKTNAPQNVSIVWTESKTELYWNYPKSKMENITSFTIHVEKINTLLINSSPYELNVVYNVTTTRDNFIYEISQNIPLSSSYLVRIQANGHNNLRNNIETQEISSPPAMPRFTDSLTVQFYSDTAQNITIPAADPATFTRNSALYVLVCNSSSLMKKQLDDFHSWIGCKGSSWIVFKTIPQTYNTNFIVGNITNNPKNIELNPFGSYTISVILINEYNGKKSYIILTTEPELLTNSNSALNAFLLLLLLIPVIIWFIYRKVNSLKRRKETSIHYKAVPTEQNNVIINVNINKEAIVQVDKKLDNKNINILKVNNLKKSQAVKVSNFSKYVKETLESGNLRKQFELLLEGGTKPWTVGTNPENVKKNRYKNLTAYDHSRVILTKISQDPTSDFINANYIDGYEQKHTYIATQGPKESTINDFWRMIWQENIQVIVMMTNLIEEGKVKCAKYWPDINKTAVYGNISVTYLKTDIYADFKYRTLKIEQNNAVRKIEHYHYTSWPDHGVPLYAQSLVPFLKKLQILPKTAPIVVHCSAGVGRTGTIILVDICLRMAASEGEINILKYLNNIREQRVNLVASYDQYLLVHMVLLECLLTPTTNFPCSKLSETFDELLQNDGIENQIKYLKDTAWHNQIMRNIEFDTRNASKNRFPDIVPNGRRIYLSRYPLEDETSIYINAVPVDGFRLKDPFIVTQNPLPHTIKDFWRMISKFNVKLIVSLNEMKYNDMNYQFWPSENEEITPVPFLSIKFKSVAKSEIYDVYKFLIEDKKEKQTKYVRILQFKNWTHEKIIPEKEGDLIRLIDTEQKLSREGYPVVITCFDGVTACGLYVSLSFMIEKIKLEQTCDVCLAVRTVRSNREEFVQNTIQFEFLYKVAILYVSTFDIYSNFI